MTAALRGIVAALAGLVLTGCPAAAEPFLDVFTGKSHTRNADVRIRQGLVTDVTIHDVSFRDESFSDPPYYGVRIGYFFDRLPWLGLALDFTHFKMLTDTGQSRRFSGVVGGAAVDVQQPVDAVVQRFDVTHGVNYVTANALVRYGLLADDDRFPHGRLQLYAGAGLGPVITHAESTVGRVADGGSYEVAGLGVQAFAGVRTMLFKYVGVFAQYRFSHSRLDVGVTAGRATVDENTHHVVGGLTFSFPSF